MKRFELWRSRFSSVLALSALLVFTVPTAFADDPNLVHYSWTIHCGQDVMTAQIDCPQGQVGHVSYDCVSHTIGASCLDQG